MFFVLRDAQAWAGPADTLLMNRWPFDGLRACKPTVIADGHGRANCGTQALIAAITANAIRDVSENPWR